MITRRQFLTSGTAAVAAPPTLWAATTATLGSIRIDTLSDGFLALPEAYMFGGMDTQEIAALRARFALPQGLLLPSCNVTLLRDGKNTVLFDLGAGPDFMPSTGELPEALDLLGIAPDEITHVIFTHAHPDHLWGLLDDFDEPLFPRALHMIGGAEYAYWTDPATRETIGEDRLSFAVGAARRLELIADDIVLFDDGDDLLPPVRARLTPGHTPGHMSFEISADGERLLLAGDAVGNHHVAFEQPDFLTPADQDPALGAETRTALLQELAESGDAILGYHLPGGGIGRVAREVTGFRFVEA